MQPIKSIEYRYCIPFGGIIAVNQTLDIETAKSIDKIFTEITLSLGFY